MIGILVVNLGTPDAPAAPAVRRYLREFLSDTRVVELPRILWWPILNGPILLFRPARSARNYASIWLPDGSPLMVYSQRQCDALQARWDQQFPGQVRVELAMRYGKPSIAQGLAVLRDAGCRKIFVVPLYPQYAAATTASIFDAVGKALRQWREIPEIRMIRDWYEHPAYIHALADSIRAWWQEHGQAERLLISFHGLPESGVAKGDPYRSQCEKTTALLVKELALSDEQWVQTFQSRFGAAKWLQPYTDKTLVELAHSGVFRIDVVCPGFSADCVETLQEIALEGKETFLQAGGQELRYIPALNDNPLWMAAFSQILEPHWRHWESSENFAVSAQSG
ncbi:ferrochelatase [Acidithiobacillus ferrivorans]|uniref:Ferrochelatase n=1 Tax=Acidithiobacillus ferrivorans TaxID=160808 RepID=A0A7T5BGN9_9PROT|nr:ferrochelatase [Acidithiobacillus ferrivorans]MBN6739899.1 ferrochelatase [Acidithiobacillus sp. MC6.1]QQD72536.1 ferrochelatase [Acidithiobacillus ferrivorans]